MTFNERSELTEATRVFGYWFIICRGILSLNSKSISVIKYAIVTIFVLLLACLIHLWLNRILNLGTTPLTQACEVGDLDAVRTLIIGGANVNEKERGKRLRTPLIAAANEGHDEVVQYLLSHGAEPNMQDLNGETALMWAVRQGDEKKQMVTLLLDAGARINITNYFGVTALDFTKSAINGRQNYQELLKRTSSAKN